MAEKIKLKSIASAITDFNLPITVTTVTGAECEVTFKARGMSFGEWLKIAQEIKNERAQEAKEQTQRIAARQDSSDQVKATEEAIETLIGLDLVALREESLSKSLARVMQLAVGWDMKDEFNEENLRAFDDIAPGALRQFVEEYGAHINGQKRKN